MRIFIIFTAALISVFTVRSQTWFESKFERNGLADWETVSGSWYSDSGKIKINTENYHQMLMSNYKIVSNNPFTIEVELRGNRAGIFFGITNIDGTYLSQVVSFDQKNLHTGYWTPANGFTNSGNFEIELDSAEWANLKVEIFPEKGSYSVHLNDTLVGTDNDLIFNKGFIGLLGSSGLSEFRKVKINGDGRNIEPAPQEIGEEVTFNNLRYIKRTEDDLLVYNETLNTYLIIDFNGRIKDFKTADKKPAMINEINIANRGYKISEKKIVVYDRSGEKIFEFGKELTDPAYLLTDGKVLYVSDPGSAGIYMFDLEGNLKKSFYANSSGGLLYPQSMDFFDKNLMVLADVNKILFIPRSLNDVKPTVIESNLGEVIIQWSSASGAEPVVEFTDDNSEWNRITGTRLPNTKINEVVLYNLKPFTIYSYKIYPGLYVIPRSASREKLFSFTTSKFENR